MNQLIKKLLREALNVGSDFTFNIESRDHYKGQDYMVINMFKGEERLAFADFSIYEGKVFIDIVESIVKGQGYGTLIMQHLAEVYSYENLERTSLTPDGVKMRARLDKTYNFNYDKHKENQSNHLTLKHIDNIKNPMIKEFLKDMVLNGYKYTWAKWLKNPDFSEFNNSLSTKYDLDFNDVSDISEWVKGSVTNDNRPDDDVPSPVLKDLGKIFKI